MLHLINGYLSQHTYLFETNVFLMFSVFCFYRTQNLLNYDFEPEAQTKI